MTNLYFTLFLLSISAISNGQTCIHENLSKSFDFKIKIERIKKNDQLDTCFVSVTVIKKSSKEEIQKINYGSGYFFEPVFKDCSLVRSYNTGINKNAIVEDNDYGDFIVADFNFDNKDDFATKLNSGGNGGPIYNFYIQDGNEKFIYDDFLSNTMIFFPFKINKTKKTLTTLAHANVLELSKIVYKYNSKTKKWKRVNHTFIPY